MCNRTDAIYEDIRMNFIYKQINQFDVDFFIFLGVVIMNADKKDDKSDKKSSGKKSKDDKKLK